jgi:hypothetical protein
MHNHSSNILICENEKFYQKISLENESTPALLNIFTFVNNLEIILILFYCCIVEFLWKAVMRKKVSRTSQGLAIFKIQPNGLRQS